MLHHKIRTETLNINEIT